MMTADGFLCRDERHCKVLIESSKVVLPGMEITKGDPLTMSFSAHDHLAIGVP